jgi:hypothetical protein
VTAFLPLAQADWGTVPDWLEAFGTLAAFAVALRLLAKELAARREVEEDRRRAQARLMSAWITTWLPAGADMKSHAIRVAPGRPPRSPEEQPKAFVIVRNGSDEPVSDVRATMTTIAVHLLPQAADPEAASGSQWSPMTGGHILGEQIYVSWSMLAPLETKGAPLLIARFPRPTWDVVIALSFTDSQGRRWKRLPDGTLTEVTKRRRRSRKDYYNAWIAGELEHLDY